MLITAKYKKMALNGEWKREQRSGEYDDWKLTLYWIYHASRCSSQQVFHPLRVVLPGLYLFMQTAPMAITWDWVIIWTCAAATHQRGLTQQFASSDQVADGDVEVGVPTAPVGDLGEGVGGQDVLQRHREG